MEISSILCTVLAVLISLHAARSEDPMCGTPPDVEYASITNPTSDENPVGTTATYACEFGFVIDGTSRTSHCELGEDGEQAEWTNPQMSCIPRSCGDPGFVTNGHRIGSLFTFPNSVSFECEEGFRLVGNTRRFCRASGSWSGRLPQCNSVSCEPPDNPENGQVIYDSLDYGSELKFECNTGYILSDLKPVICSADGTWSRSKSVCVEATCEIPQRPIHGFMELIGSDGHPRAGTIAIFSCEGGRIPDGPTTSKCLDIGQWTFATPQCLDPCQIPAVPNGKIGRYVSQNRRTAVFKEIPVGSKIEDGEKLFLHCSSGYSPLGTGEWQEKVICSAGKWSDVPRCEPSDCRMEPPATENGKAENVNSKHGGTVYYRCLPYAEKVKSGNVTCLLGQWKGVTPICKDTRCLTALLDFSGFEKGDPSLYLDGEELPIVCDRRYTVAAGNNGRMKCEKGVWRGPMPPCIAASCSGSPANIDHGWAEVTSVIHSSFAKYVCEPQYTLVGNNQVQCLFGEWNGRPPKCDDSRCHIKNLKFSIGVSSETEQLTSSGNRLNVLCSDGYTPRTMLPQCVNGVWSPNTESPCKERDCSAQWIQQGIIREEKLGPSTWWKFGYGRELIYENVPLGSIPSRSANLFLFCYSGFSVQGTGLVSARIHCSQGRWSPDPVCILNGMKYVPTTRATEYKPTTSTTSQPPILRTSASRLMPASSTVPQEETEPERETTLSLTEDSMEEELCSCEYTLNDENVVAYTDDKQLKFYDRVRDGSLVKFRCKNVGFHHLNGKQEIVCENCQAWHSSDFPSCVDPKSGDAVIFYDSNVNVTMDGVLEVEKGQTVRLTCIAMEKAEFPEWRTDHQNGINVFNERTVRVGDILYVSYLDILSPDAENEGLYECAVGENNPSFIELRVIDPNVRCPKFDDEEELIITYDLDTRVGSQATFSCRKYEHTLNGTDVLTCLKNGEWSSPPPQCTDVRCKELKGTDIMHISYTEDRTIGGFASFHCFAPGRRTGVARTQCLESGEWADPIPTCKTSPCSSESLFAAVPQGVEPNMNDVNNDSMPYNSTVRLMCGGDLLLVGHPMAKCGRNGNWEMDDVQCVSGCLKLTKSPASKLIMQPDKDVYKIGEFVSFLCPPGLYLNLELVKIMCLKSGWSEDLLPECVYRHNELDYE